MCCIISFNKEVSDYKVEMMLANVSIEKILTLVADGRTFSCGAVILS